MNTHPTAVISTHAKMGEFTYIGAFSVVERGADVGEGTRIMSHVSIGEGVHIGEYCFVGTGCVLDPRVVLGNRVTLGPRVTCSGLLVIGDDCQLGAGSVLVGATVGLEPLRIKKNSVVEPGSVLTEEVAIYEDLVEKEVP